MGEWAGEEQAREEQAGEWACARLNGTSMHMNSGQ